MINKAVLAKEITKSDFSHNQRTAELCIDIVLNSIAKALSKGERIELRGFGTFSVKRRAARKTSINGNITVPEHGKVFFLPCESLRKAAWNYGNGKAGK